MMMQVQALKEVQNGVLSKFPLLGPVMQKLVFEITDKTETADTNGNNVWVSPSFLEKLSFEEKIALFAHEVMHVAFDHIIRSKNRIAYYWNIATDAVINQMIIDAGLPLPQGGINLPNARGKSAEEMYEHVLMHKDQFKEEPQSDTSHDNHQNTGEMSVGNHELWEEALKQLEQEQGDKQTQTTKAELSNAREKQFTQVNEKLKQKLARKIMEDLKAEKGLAHGENQGAMKTDLGAVGEAQPIENWQKVLRRKFKELEEAYWSYRRADRNNDWQPRVEYKYREDKALVEVMLDTSGSVDDNLLRGFLREIKNLVRNAELKVGCFDTQFYGFQSIKKVSDIDQLQIVGRGGTSFDEALAHFSKERMQNVYKIIFTDGLDVVTDKEENRRIKNLFWLVWRDIEFKPCCGKVLKVDPNEIRQMFKENQAHQNDDLGRTR